MCVRRCRRSVGVIFSPPIPPSRVGGVVVAEPACTASLRSPSYIPPSWVAGWWRRRGLACPPFLGAAWVRLGRRVVCRGCGVLQGRVFPAFGDGGDWRPFFPLCFSSPATLQKGRQRSGARRGKQMADRQRGLAGEGQPNNDGGDGGRARHAMDGRPAVGCLSPMRLIPRGSVG